MNKTQFNKHIRTALTKRLRNSNIDEANAVIDVFIDGVLTALEEDNEISLIGFGRFYKTHTEARTGRNPKTGESIKIAAYYQPRFAAGIKLKEACNKKEKNKKPKK